MSIAPKVGNDLFGTKVYTLNMALRNSANTADSSLGIFTCTNYSGATVTGDSTRSITFVGSQSQVNSAVSQTRFVPNADVQVNLSFNWTHTDDNGTGTPGSNPVNANMALNIDQTHSEFNWLSASSMTVNEDSFIAPINFGQITDLRPDNIDSNINYTITFTPTVANAIQSINGNTTSPFVFTGTKDYCNNILANLDIILGFDYTGSFTLNYSQVQSTNGITQTTSPYIDFTVTPFANFILNSPTTIVYNEDQAINTNFGIILDENPNDPQYRLEFRPTNDNVLTIDGPRGSGTLVQSYPQPPIPTQVYTGNKSDCNNFLANLSISFEHDAAQSTVLEYKQFSDFNTAQYRLQETASVNLDIGAVHDEFSITNTLDISSVGWNYKYLGSITDQYTSTFPINYTVKIKGYRGLIDNMDEDSSFINVSSGTVAGFDMNNEGDTIVLISNAAGTLDDPFLEIHERTGWNWNLVQTINSTNFLDPKGIIELDGSTIAVQDKTPQISTPLTGSSFSTVVEVESVMIEGVLTNVNVYYMDGVDSLFASELIVGDEVGTSTTNTRREVLEIVSNTRIRLGGTMTIYSFDNLNKLSGDLMAVHILEKNGTTGVWEYSQLITEPRWTMGIYTSFDDNLSLKNNTIAWGFTNDEMVIYKKNGTTGVWEYSQTIYHKAERVLLSPDGSSLLLRNDSSSYSGDSLGVALFREDVNGDFQFINDLTYASESPNHFGFGINGSVVISYMFANNGGTLISFNDITDTGYSTGSYGSAPSGADHDTFGKYFCMAPDMQNYIASNKFDRIYGINSYNPSYSQGFSIATPFTISRARLQSNLNFDNSTIFAIRGWRSSEGIYVGSFGNDNPRDYYIEGTKDFCNSRLANLPMNFLGTTPSDITYEQYYYNNIIQGTQTITIV